MHKKRFYMAEETPICRGNLRGQFGYTAISPTAEAVLNGTYDFPPDIDSATRDLFIEIAKIGSTVPANSAN